MEIMQASDALSHWRAQLRDKTPVVRYPVGEPDSGLDGFELRPGRILVLGGGPAIGKSALTLQLTFDSLRLNPNLCALILSVEMPVDEILNRQVARIAGVPVNLVRDRELDDESHDERIGIAIDELDAIAGRLYFALPPWNLAEIQQAVAQVTPSVLLVDYLQRVDVEGVTDVRRQVNASMSWLRQFVAGGASAFVVSALARPDKSTERRNLDLSDVSMHLFRESGEVELGADSAFILVEYRKAICAVCVKARFGAPKHVALDFDKPLQRFRGVPIEPNEKGEASRSPDLTTAWQGFR